MTVNPHLEQDSYPLPTQQDLFSTLNGGKYFTKLDLQQAYQQIELEPETQKYLTVNTHLGLFKPTRMPYGITTAPAVFQRIMDRMLVGLPNTICYQDDILVTSATEAEHIEILKQVFERLDKHQVKLNKDKCKFMLKQIEFLGHRISGEGIHPTGEKISAITNMDEPENVSELRTFLGLLNYYVKFIKDASTFLNPLYTLLHADHKWDWTDECHQTFEKCKTLLTSKTVLTHYNPNKEIKLSCDASPFGLGCIISHEIGGSDKPIAYASRTLAQAEKNYSHLEKEALAIVFGLKRFQQYLVGRRFTIVTDHKPLLSLFSPTKATPILAAARIQRWSLLLSSFDYQIEYKKGSDHQNVDTLSRFPEKGDFQIESKTYKLSYVEDLPITSEVIKKHTRDDRVLGRVLNYTKDSWPNSIDEEFKPYSARRDQLSVENDNVLWGMRVIIPKRLRGQILDVLHDTHSGITQMKAVARSHIWWPGMDQEIENLARSCLACRHTQKMPPQTPLQSWTWPKGAWDRIHIDFAQKDTKFFMIVVDAYSKWLQVIKMKRITSLETIRVLRRLFSDFGFPKEVVSDNGPQLVSHEFGSFLRGNAIKHTLIPTYHPSSNGLAERNVQSFKNILNKMNIDQGDHTSLEHKIDRYLMSQHSTPHATTGQTPAKLFLGHEIRTRLSLVHTEIRDRVEKKLNQQKLGFDRAHGSFRTTAVGEKVWIRNFSGTLKWIPAIVERQESSKTWIVNTVGGKRTVHIDQIRSGNKYEMGEQQGTCNAPVESEELTSENAEVDVGVGLLEGKRNCEELPEILVASEMSGQKECIISKDVHLHGETTESRRYPLRVRTKPKGLDNYVI